MIFYEAWRYDEIPVFFLFDSEKKIGKKTSEQTMVKSEVVRAQKLKHLIFYNRREGV